MGCDRTLLNEITEAWILTKGLIFQIFNPETISAKFCIVHPPVIFFIEYGWLENQFENKTTKQDFQNTGETLTSNACILVTQAYSWSQILPLYPNTKLNLRDKSFEWSRKTKTKTAVMLCQAKGDAVG